MTASVTANSDAALRSSLELAKQTREFVESVPRRRAVAKHDADRALAAIELDKAHATAAEAFLRLRKEDMVADLESQYPHQDEFRRALKQDYPQRISAVASRRDPKLPTLDWGAVSDVARAISATDFDFIELRDDPVPYKKFSAAFDAVHEELSKIPTWKSSIFGRRDRSEQATEYAEQLVRLVALFDRYIDHLHATTTATIRSISGPSADDDEVRKLLDGCRRAEAAVRTQQTSALAAIDHEIAQGMNDLSGKWAATSKTLDAIAPRWTSPHWASWSPSTEVQPHLRVGEVISGSSSAPMRMPLLWPFPRQVSVAILVDSKSREQGVQCAQSLTLRIMAGVPPGKARFVFCDPVARAATFAPFFHLRDEASEIVGDVIRCEANEIEETLKGLTNHMSHVQQDFLRGEYRNLEAYNKAVGEVQEAYRVLVYADAPAGLMGAASAERLQNIMSSGPGCGVYCVLVIDPSVPAPHGVSTDRLIAPAMTIDLRGGQAKVTSGPVAGLKVALEGPPDLRIGQSSGVFSKVMSAVAAGARQARVIQTPFEKGLEIFVGKAASSPDAYPGISPGFEARRPATWWKCSSQDSLIAPIGRLGANDLQEMRFSRFKSSVLVIGQPGSGKTNMIYVLVSALCILYSPDELGLYLLDFKEGADFALWSDPANPLPHLCATGIYTDPDYGLAVLTEVQAEMTRRMTLFTAEGQHSGTLTENITQYREVTGKKLPRLVVILDEFQRLAGGQTAIADQARSILEDVVRRGSSAGVHLLLATQTLYGLNSMKPMFGLMSSKLAYKCEPQDAAMLFGDQNTDARLIERPGEAIYNDQNGQAAFNRQFQTSFLAARPSGSSTAGGTKEAYAAAISKLAANRSIPTAAPRLFDGSRLPLHEQRLRPLAGVVHATPIVTLGDSPILEPPVDVSLQRRNANHILVIGGLPTFRHAIVQNALVSFRLTAPTSRIVYIDFGRFDLLESAPNERVIDRAGFSYKPSDGGELPLSLLSPLAVVGNLLDADVRPPHESADVLGSLADEVSNRLATRGDFDPILLVLNEIEYGQEIRKRMSAGLGRDSAPDAGASLEAIIRQGAAVGVFVLCTVDTHTGYDGVFGARYDAFGQRVILTLGENESRNVANDSSASAIRPGRGLRLVAQGNRRSPFRPYLPLTTAQVARAMEASRAFHAAHVERNS